MDEHALLTRPESVQSTVDMDPQAPSSPSEPSTPPAPSPNAGCDEQSISPDSSNTLPSDSQSSLELSLDPSTPVGDEERHPKGKRKRTAVKDKAVLETAYNANPKPDKAARLDIVKRVSLNEKEVQIWFQNRRQNDRRKSRPLSPQELAALRYGGMQVVAIDQVYNSSFSSDNTNPSPAPNMSPSELAAPSSPHSDPATFNSSDEAEKVREVPQEVRAWDKSESVSEKESATPMSSEREPRQLLSRSFSGSIGYLSNRWNLASSFSTPSPLSRDDSSRPEIFPSSCPPAISSGSVLPPPGSQPSRFRLSMSLEGKAEVVPSIPLPPRPVIAPPTPDALHSLGSIRRPELQRSYSTSAVTLPPISMLTNSLPPPNSGPLPPRLTRGRSRDVHAWEFCCSDNLEDALTVQAKHESRGSAIAAISLLRSTSSTGGSPLQQSSSAKRNATMITAAPRGGMAKRAKLSRTTSSVARMQTTLGPSGKHNIQRDLGKLSDKPKASPLVSLSGHDSDKENWSPDEEGNPRASFRQNPRTNGTSSGRRPLPSGPSKLDRKHPRRTPARVLHDARNSAFLSNRANTAPTNGFRRGKRAESPLDIYEDSENNSPASRPVLDDEVQRFMRGEVSPSKKGDVDAVAGLLSLSQGNWR